MWYNVAQMKHSKIKTVFNKSTPDSRAKDIEEAMHLVWGSLQSHLKWCHKNSVEGKAFEKACVQEYAQIVKLLSKLY